MAGNNSGNYPTMIIRKIIPEPVLRFEFQDDSLFRSGQDFGDVRNLAATRTTADVTNFEPHIILKIYLDINLEK